MRARNGATEGPRVGCEVRKWLSMVFGDMYVGSTRPPKMRISGIPRLESQRHPQLFAWTFVLARPAAMVARVAFHVSGEEDG